MACYGDEQKNQFQHDPKVLEPPYHGTSWLTILEPAVISLPTYAWSGDSNLFCPACMPYGVTESRYIYIGMSMCS